MTITDKHIIELVRNAEDVQKIWNDAKSKKPLAANANELVLYDYISDYTLSEVRRFIKNASGDIVIKINSWGGDVFSGFAIYNELSEYKGAITTKVMGMAASAAALIFLSGEKRLMKAQSMLMFHKSWNCVCGNADELKKSAETLDKIDEMMGDLIERKLELGDESINDFLVKETFLTVKDAMKVKAAEEDPDDDDEYEKNEDEDEKKSEEEEKEKAELIKVQIKNLKDMGVGMMFTSVQN